MATRSSVLAADPDPFAGHVLSTLLGYLEGESRCGSEELHLLARPYRWSRLWDDLASTDPAERRHPRSADWERWYGREIPGATVGEQLAAVTAWFDADLASPAVRRAVAFGVRSPSAIERSVGSTLGDGGWAGRLAAAVEENFARCSWPVRYLVPAEGSEQP